MICYYILCVYIVVYLSKYNLYLTCLLFLNGPEVRMAFIVSIFASHLKLKNRETRTGKKERKTKHGPSCINYMPGQWVFTPVPKRCLLPAIGRACC